MSQRIANDSAQLRYSCKVHEPFHNVKLLGEELRISSWVFHKSWMICRRLQFSKRPSSTQASLLTCAWSSRINLSTETFIPAMSWWSRLISSWPWLVPGKSKEWLYQAPSKGWLELTYTHTHTYIYAQRLGFAFIEDLQYGFKSLTLVKLLHSLKIFDNGVTLPPPFNYIH